MKKAKSPVGIERQGAPVRGRATVAATAENELGRTQVTTVRCSKAAAMMWRNAERADETRIDQ